MLSALALLTIACFLAPTAADADLWGHLTFGRDIVRQAWVHTSDPYSFTSDRPWINHEWLAEVLLWISYALGGTAGLVAFKLLVATGVGVIVLATWRRYTLRPAWRDALLFATALGTWPLFATVRPQIFSLLLFALLLLVLQKVRETRVKWSLMLPLLFAVWPNVHGGWVVGAGVLVIFVACSIFDKAFDARARFLLLTAAVAAFLATFLNPYGRRMFGFLFETVGPNRSDVVEWLPITQLPPIALVLWGLPTLIVVAAVWRGRRRLSVFSLVIAVLLGVGAFRVARLLGFYALAVGMLLAPAIPADSTVEEHRPSGRRLWSTAAVCLLTIFIAGMLFGRRITMDGPWLPEAEAAVFVRTHRLSGRMLTWFDYGEYAIWHFAPGIRVSMDGRRETIYSEDVRALHWRIYRNEERAVEDVDRLKPDYIWLPINFGIIPRLKSDGWHPLFTGSRSVLLGRQLFATPNLPNRRGHLALSPDGGNGWDQGLPRYFPGP